MHKTHLNKQCEPVKRISFSVKLFVGIAVPFLLLCLTASNFRYRNSSQKDLPAKMAAATKELFLIKPSIKATASVIFLHGLGDNGSGWYHAFDELKKKDVRYIFPNAPSMPVTLNGGFVMPSCLTLDTAKPVSCISKNEAVHKGLDPNVPEDVAGIKSAAEKIRALIKTENQEHGIPYNRILLGGFSMGGSLALYTALTHQEQLGGIIALSSWLPLHKNFVAGEEGLSLQNQRCKIFQGHGAVDPMVPPNFGQLTHKLLKDARSFPGSETQFKLYQHMGHQSSDEEMDDVKTFIDKCLS